MGDLLDHNFWHFAISGVVMYLVSIIAPFFPPHTNLGLAATVGGYGAELFVILFVFMGAFIKLDTLARFVLLSLLVVLIKNKGKILNVIALVRFFI